MPDQECQDFTMMPLFIGVVLMHFIAQTFLSSNCMAYIINEIKTQDITMIRLEIS